jgi:hypothetical protein
MGTVDWPTATAVLGAVGIIAGAAVKIFGRSKPKPEGNPGNAGNPSDPRLAPAPAAEVAAVKEDVAALKTDVAVLKTEQKNLTRSVDRVAEAVDRNHDEQKQNSAAVSGKIDDLARLIVNRNNRDNG